MVPAAFCCCNFFYTHCIILLCVLQNWFYYLELACCFENCDKTYRKWSNKAFLGWKRGNWNEPCECNINQFHRLYISLGSAEHPVGGNGKLWRRRCVIVWHIAQAQASHWEPSCRFAFASMESLLGEEQRWSVAAICPTHIERLFVCFVLFFWRSCSARVVCWSSPGGGVAWQGGHYKMRRRTNHSDSQQEEK